MSAQTLTCTVSLHPSPMERSQYNPKQPTSTLSALPEPATATGDAALVKKIDHPERRFAKYKLAPQTPSMATISSGRGGAGGSGSRWKIDDLRSAGEDRGRSWGGSGGRRGFGGSNWGGYGKWSAGGGGGRSGGRGRTWGGGGGRSTGGGSRRPPDWKDWLWKYLEEPRAAKQEARNGVSEGLEVHSP